MQPRSHACRGPIVNADQVAVKLEYEKATGHTKYAAARGCGAKGDKAHQHDRKDFSTEQAVAQHKMIFFFQSRILYSPSIAHTHIHASTRFRVGVAQPSARNFMFPHLGYLLASACLVDRRQISRTCLRISFSHYISLLCITGYVNWENRFSSITSFGKCQRKNVALENTIESFISIQKLASFRAR